MHNELNKVLQSVTTNKIFNTEAILIHINKKPDMIPVLLVTFSAHVTAHYSWSFSK